MSNEDATNYEVKGIKEIMLCQFSIEKTELYSMDPSELKELINNKILEESEQVFVVDKNKFTISDYKGAVEVEYDIHPPDEPVEDNHVRLVCWEELEGAKVNIEIPNRLDSLNLILQGSTYGCMDDWGFDTFQYCDLKTPDEEYYPFFESESFGEQEDKVLYFIDSNGNCESIRDLDNNEDIESEFSEIIEALKK